MKHNWKEESLRLKTLLTEVSSKTGTTWKKYGTTPFTTNWRCHQRNILASWPKLLLILKQTEREWPKSCSKSSMCLAFMLLFNQCCPFTLQVELQVSFWTQEMESHTLAQFMKGMPSLMPSKKSNYQEKTSLSTSENSWKKEVIHSQLPLSSKLSETSKRDFATSSSKTSTWQWKKPPRAALGKRPTSFQTEDQSLLVTKLSDLQRSCSSLNMQDLKWREFTNTHSTLWWSATLTWEKIYSWTSSSLEVLLSSKEWVTECITKFTRLPHRLIRSKCWLHQRESTPSGLEDPF